MDLKDLTPKSDTIDIELFHPTSYEPLTNEDGSVMTITVYAPHTKEYKAVIHEQANKRLKQAQSKKKNEITSEELEEASINLLVKVTKDWNITYDGKKPKATDAKVREIYTEVFWIRNQIEGGMQDYLDFTKT